MSNLLNIALLVIAGFGVIFLLKKKLWNKNKHIVVVDPEAQRLYDAKKHVLPDEKKTLSLQERIDISWQFLVNIKDIVINKFSKQDQEKLHQAAHTLIENGMRYQHDVEREVKIKEISKVQLVSKPKEQEQSHSR